ncbi:YdeI/OmpD-associated family protein [Angustibacter peucedani]
MTFRSTVLLGGKTATGIPLPDAEVEALGGGRKPAVTVTVNGYSYRTTVASRDGVYLVPLSAENRSAAGVAAGDEVEVSLALDTAPRELEVPDDLQAALDAEPAARAFFDGLSYSKRQWFVLSVTGAKTAETRERRVTKALELLRDGRSH